MGTYPKVNKNPESVASSLEGSSKSRTIEMRLKRQKRPRPWEGFRSKRGVFFGGRATAVASIAAILGLSTGEAAELSLPSASCLLDMFQILRSDALAATGAPPATTLSPAEGSTLPSRRVDDGGPARRGGSSNYEGRVLRIRTGKRCGRRAVPRGAGGESGNGDGDGQWVCTCTANDGRATRSVLGARVPVVRVGG